MTPTPAPMPFVQRENEMRRLEDLLKNSGIDARVCEIVNAETAIVSGATLADFLFARSILKREGWTAIKPRTQI